MYAIMLFVDIEEAFDNIWWPAVLARVVEAKSSSHIINVIKSYFKHRKVKIEYMSETYVRKRQRMPPGIHNGPSCLGMVHGHTA